MKTVLITCIACLAIYWGAEAQTLQFSRVLLIDNTTPDCNTGVNCVPAGKVWKITNMLPSSRMTTATFSNSSTQNVFFVDGVQVFYASSNSTGNLNGNGQTGVTASAITMHSGAVWLPANTTLQAGAGIHRISVIEFNIIP